MSGSFARSSSIDVGGEPAVHRAVPAPQDHPRVAQLVDRQAAVGLPGIPHDAVVERETHLEHGGVAAEVLVGEEEHLAAALDGLLLRERPLERDVGIGRRAHDAAVATAERLDVGAGVHVGHGYDAVGHARVDQGVPGVLHLGEPGHVGHRAAGREVGQDDLLLGRGEDVGRLRHEVHAAEDDELRLGPARGVPRELEGVAGHVGELDDLVALVVVSQHEQPVTQRSLAARARSTSVGSEAAGRSPGHSTPRSALRSLPLPSGRRGRSMMLTCAIVGRGTQANRGEADGTTRRRALRRTGRRAGLADGRADP